jgi:integrase
MEKSENTIKTYNTMMKRLSKEMFKGKKVKEMHIEQYQQKILDYVDEMSSLNSRYAMIVAIIDYAKQIEDFDEDVLDKYYTKMKSLRTEINKQQEKELKKPKKKDTDKILTIEEIEKLKNKYHDKLTSEYSPVNDIRYVMFNLYSHPDLAPLRSQDYYNCKVVENKDEMEKQTDNKEHNYFLLKEGLFIRNIGKTVKFYGTRMITIPQSIIEVVRQFHDKSKSEWLVPNTMDKTQPMEQSHFTKLMQRGIQQEYGKKKKISSSMVRKIRVSTEINKILKDYPQFEEANQRLKNLAADMGHGTITQQLVYSRLRNNV